MTKLLGAELLLGRCLNEFRQQQSDYHQRLHDSSLMSDLHAALYAKSIPRSTWFDDWMGGIIGCAHSADKLRDQIRLRFAILENENATLRFIISKMDN